MLILFLIKRDNIENIEQNFEMDRKRLIEVDDLCYFDIEVSVIDLCGANALRSLI